MRVIVFGGTGMVGQGVLRECRLAADVTEVLVIGRSPTGKVDPKLRELVRADLLDYGDVEDQLAPYDACFFCLGVSSVGMKEADYRRITYDLTMAAARPLARLNPGMTFILVVGRPLWPLLRKVAPNGVTDSEKIGRAMPRVAREGVPKPPLTNRDINAL